MEFFIKETRNKSECFKIWQMQHFNLNLSNPSTLSMYSMIRGIIESEQIIKECSLLPEILWKDELYDT